MMHHFLKNNQHLILERCRTLAQNRNVIHLDGFETDRALPSLISELIIRMPGAVVETRDGHEVETFERGRSQDSRIGQAATGAGRALFVAGVGITEVVLGYGDLCQVITGLAEERDAPFQVSEYRILNLCIDTAIANAVAGFTIERENQLAQANIDAQREQNGMYAHEMRNLIHTTLLAFTALKLGNLSAVSATGELAERSLLRLGKLTDDLLLEVAQANTVHSEEQTFALAPLILEIEEAAMLASHVRGIAFSVGPVSPLIILCGERDALYEAVTNLIQNAFKFTRRDSGVVLKVFVDVDVVIEVHDECGGLPLQSSSLFDPFVQVGTDRTGLGLGLAIVKRNIEGMRGTVDVTNIPDHGCIFTVRLPLHRS